MLNGIASHTFDYDDTHLRTIIHPAGPVASAALALAEHTRRRRAAAGRRASCSASTSRAASATSIYPDHYDRGWHITGSTGMLGAAAACARLLGLDAQRTAMALGIAASQPIGVREQFGSMTKPFHVGGAARAGLMSALMARHGYHRLGPRARSAARAAADLLDQVRLERDHRRARPALRDLVQHLQALRLRHRDSSQHRRLRAARRAHGLRADDIERIELKVHPLVLELTGKTAPRTGLEGKFSVYHACAAGNPVRQGRRGRIRRRRRRARRRDRAARSRPRDGRRGHRRSVGRRDGHAARMVAGCTRSSRHAIGSLERPMTDADLARKFHGLVDPVLGAARADGLIDAVRALAACADVRALRGADARLAMTRRDARSRSLLAAGAARDRRSRPRWPRRIFRSSATSCTGRGCGSPART